MSLLRTVVFGAILGAVGKKLYQSGSLDRFGDDLKTRLGEAKGKIDDLRAGQSNTAGAPALRETRSATPSPVVHPSAVKSA